MTDDLRDEWRARAEAAEAALAGAVEALKQIRDCMGGDEGGWDSPEDVWRIADGALKKLPAPHPAAHGEEVKK